MSLIEQEPHFPDSLPEWVQGSCQERWLTCNVQEWSNSCEVVLWRWKQVPGCVCLSSAIVILLATLAEERPTATAGHSLLLWILSQAPMNVHGHSALFVLMRSSCPCRLWFVLTGTNVSLLLSTSSFPSWVPVWLTCRDFSFTVSCEAAADLPTSIPFAYSPILKQISYSRGSQTFWAHSALSVSVLFSQCRWAKRNTKQFHLLSGYIQTTEVFL